ncbi:urease accessory protein UreD [Pseudaquabacterium rugosum]|uniref:Urease accessory protein UreD n=1 Tax=Pseudaquabacterium rugosum TaxID=2984194 RepID=A0ABU9BEK2_9BURK
MGWHGHLQLDYTRDGDRTIALDRHHGPLRVLQRLYPEGDAICHHVLVHPPGGIAGGDVLALDGQLASGTHAVITTPGATRFYRSAGPLAEQQVHFTLADGARLEWLPLETIAYPSCQVDNTLRFDLAPTAQLMGWDLLALGLPAAGQAWTGGRYAQRLELPGRWLERGVLDSADRLLLDSPLGLAGHGVLATLFLADGAAMTRTRREDLLEAARERIEASPLTPQAGVSALDEGLIVLRVLADRVEPAMTLLQQVRAAWRPLHWGLPAHTPRIWRM